LDCFQLRLLEKSKSVSNEAPTRRYNTERNACRDRPIDRSARQKVFTDETFVRSKSKIRIDGRGESVTLHRVIIQMQ